MRAVNRLTGNKVRNAKPGPDGKTVLLCDGGGLWLQVGLGKDKQIIKSWIFPLRPPARRSARPAASATPKGGTPLLRS
jgi:hypothetical protein